MLCIAWMVSFASVPVPVPSHAAWCLIWVVHWLCAAHVQYYGHGESQCAQLTGGGSGSGGKAAQAWRGLGPGGTRLAPDLQAPELGAPCPRWAAATGGHGSNPEATAHTCTTSEHSAAVVSRQRQGAGTGRREKENRSTCEPPESGQTSKQASDSTFYLSPDYLELA